MARCTPRPVWLNLSTSAREGLVVGHRPSVAPPRLPLRQHFFFPRSDRTIRRCSARPITPIVAQPVRGCRLLACASISPPPAPDELRACVREPGQLSCLDLCRRRPVTAWNAGGRLPGRTRLRVERSAPRRPACARRAPRCCPCRPTMSCCGPATTTSDRGTPSSAPSGPSIRSSGTSTRRPMTPSPGKARSLIPGGTVAGRIRCRRPAAHRLPAGLEPRARRRAGLAGVPAALAGARLRYGGVGLQACGPDPARASLSVIGQRC